MSNVDGARLSRKYPTEFGLVITVCPRYVGRQQDLARVSSRFNENCHLYIVSKKPRLSVDPSTVSIGRDEISFTLRMQKADQFKYFSITERNLLGRHDVSWTSEWPFEDFSIVTDDGECVANGVVSLLFAYCRQWPKLAQRHEISYVGQAFGKGGERTAWDRLKKHETVQRIYSESKPDEQVWLTLADISDLQLAIDANPLVPAVFSDLQDNEHIDYVARRVERDQYFRDREAVALAEAGLIRYFQPEYNNQMKYSFPARDHVSLQSARDVDLHTLTVELQGLTIGSLFGSATRRYSGLHFGNFAVHHDQDRELSLSYED